MQLWCAWLLAYVRGEQVSESEEVRLCGAETGTGRSTAYDWSFRRQRTLTVASWRMVGGGEVMWAAARAETWARANLAATKGPDVQRSTVGPVGNKAWARSSPSSGCGLRAVCPCGPRAMNQRLRWRPVGVCEAQRGTRGSSSVSSETKQHDRWDRVASACSPGDHSGDGNGGLRIRTGTTPNDGSRASGGGGRGGRPTPAEVGREKKQEQRWSRGCCWRLAAV